MQLVPSPTVPQGADPNRQYFYAYVQPHGNDNGILQQSRPVAAAGPVRIASPVHIILHTAVSIFQLLACLAGCERATAHPRCSFTVPT